jgi:hypothetical protein
MEICDFRATPVDTPSACSGVVHYNAVSLLSITKPVDEAGIEKVFQVFSAAENQVIEVFPP